MSKAIEASVTEYLQAHNITFQVALVGATKRDDWECDQWRTVFSKAGKVCEEMFYTGIGLRVSPKPAAYHNLQSPREVDEWKTKNAKPVTPNAASVLNSLLDDAFALDTSFDYWASDCGYDTDSRKAFDTYQKCCAIGHKVKAVFTNEEIETLRDMLQDY